MRKGKSVVVLDCYSMKVMAEYPSVRHTSEALDIPAPSIYSSICHRTACRESFFVYKRNFQDFKPAPRAFRRVNGIKVSDKLEALRSNIT